MNASRRVLIAGLAAICMGLAGAQGNDVVAGSADSVIEAGLQVLHRIDQGNADAMWASAADFVKTGMNKQEFIDSARRARADVGKVVGRDWDSVTRIRFAEGSTNPPAGLYANVDFSAHLDDGRTVYERISLRLDPGGWHWTGYVPRTQQ